MPVTLTDEQAAEVRKQLQAAERNRQIAEMVNGIYNDPSLGVEARNLIKKKYPNLQMPDHDLRTEFNARLDADKQAREAAEKAQREKEQDDRRTSARKAAQEKYNFTDDGMKQVEDVMVERNIGDYDVAAHYVAAQRPQPSDDENYNPGFWNHGRSEEEKKIAQDPEAWARSEILKAARAEQRAFNR